MRTAIFSTHAYDREALEAANCAGSHVFEFLECGLDERTAVSAKGAPAVCAFVNDRLDAHCLAALHAGGTRLVALRSTGYDHVDVEAAERIGLTVLRTPAYSPNSVAEHAIALLLTLNRHTHVAAARARRYDFSLDGLVGFDLARKTVGVVGTGRIGAVAARILLGFGCEVIAFDPEPSGRCRALGVRYVALQELLERSHVVTMHCPLVPATRHLMDAAAFERMKPGAMLVNTSRGAVVDTEAAIAALRSGRLGGLAIDVYEGEGPLFFRDRSQEIPTDDVFARLVSFPNVLVTGHQGFLTREALAGIAEATVRNLTDFERGAPRAEMMVAGSQCRCTPERRTPAAGAAGVR